MKKKLFIICVFLASVFCSNSLAMPKNKPIDLSKPIIALTFDDGPSNHTSTIIDFLKENNIRATFFVVGNKVSEYEKVLKKAVLYGNEIGNHSYSHKWLSRLNTKQIKEEISKTQDIIYNKLNYKSKLLRPTYGGVNNKLRKSTDLKIILWNVDTMDWKYKSSDKIASRALNTVKDGSIILMHDMYDRTYDALKIIVPSLKEMGYQFVTVSELEAIKSIKN